MATACISEMTLGSTQNEIRALAKHLRQTIVRMPDESLRQFEIEPTCTLSCFQRATQGGRRVKLAFMSAALACMAAVGWVTTPAYSAGCLKGAAVGGVAGHVAGHHTVLGAGAGCIIGHHEAAKHAKQKAQQQNTEGQSEGQPSSTSSH
jgi:hypothetical protein